MMKIVKNLEKFKEKNILKTEEESIYIYQQITNKRTYTGIVCGVSTNDYKNGKIKIHEKDNRKKKNLFKDYLSICKIHAEPILLTHKSKENIKIIFKIKLKTNLILSLNQKTIKYIYFGRLILKQKYPQYNSILNL